MIDGVVNHPDGKQSVSGHRAFGLTQASGYGMLSILIMIGLVAESVPLHLLLRSWSPLGAWVFTALGIYGLVWAVALRRSLASRPFLIGAETVLLQIGSLWRVEFRRDQIRAVRRFPAPDFADGKPNDYLPLVVLNEPQWLIELNGPVMARGPYGRRKVVTRIGVAVDDGDGFGAALGNGTNLHS